jgi:hypothetical protein
MFKKKLLFIDMYTLDNIEYTLNNLHLTKYKNS